MLSLLNFVYYPRKSNLIIILRRMKRPRKSNSNEAEKRLSKNILLLSILLVVCVAGLILAWLCLRIQNERTTFNKQNENNIVYSNKNQRKSRSINQDFQQQCSTSCCETESCQIFGELLSSHMDFTVDPCTDFHQYVCGNWNRQIGKSTSSYLELIKEVIFQNLKLVFENKSTSFVNGKSKAVLYVLDLYHECVNEVKREQRGVEPLGQLLKQVLGVDEWSLDGNSNSILLILSNRDDDKVDDNVEEVLLAYDSFLEPLQTEMDFHESWNAWKNSNQNTKRENKLDLNKWMDSYVEASLVREDLIEKLFDFNGNGIKISFNEIYDFEAIENNLYEIFKGFKESISIFSNEHQLINDDPIFEILDFYLKLSKIFLKSLKINSTNGQKISLRGLKRYYSAPEFDWTVLLNKFAIRTGASFRFTEDDKVLVQIDELELIKPFTELILRTPIRVLQNSLAFQMLDFKSLLNKKSREVHDERDESSRKHKHLPLWKVCLDQNLEMFPSIYTRIFVDHVGREQMQVRRDQIHEMIQKMKESFSDSLKLRKFDSQNLLHKLESIKSDIAFPDWIFKDENLDKEFGFDPFNAKYSRKIIKENYASSIFNLLQMKNSAKFKNIKLNHEKAKEFYFIFDEMAVLKEKSNLLAISFAQLIEPWFSVDYPAALKYGKMGFTIGHEMIHSLDNYNLRSTEKNPILWNHEFKNMSKCIVKQYDGLVEPITGVKINGTHKLEENIADNAGLSQAYRVFEQNILDNCCTTQQLPSFLAQFTPEQLFFISYSAYYCSGHQNSTQLSTHYRDDTHSPYKFRVNIPLSNMAQFSRAFNCPVGSQMNPKNKCTIW